MDIKEENDDTLIHIKIESEEFLPNIDHNNPFKDIQLEVKCEIGLDKPEIKNNKVQLTIETENNDNIKEENEDSSEMDESSIESTDITALGNNEKEILPNIIKEEPDLTVTETHLISNKLLNTTSTMASVSDNIIESQTTNTLVMGIHPLLKTSKIQIGNPEEILPTSNDHDDMDYSDTFQLNSITGNVLSLEQEAYSLLKAKKQIDARLDRPCICPKCPKTYKTPSCLRKHMKVHKAVENHEMGIIKRLKTYEQNKSKKQEEGRVESYDEKLDNIIEDAKKRKNEKRQERLNKRHKKIMEAEKQLSTNPVKKKSKEKKVKMKECAVQPNIEAEVKIELKREGYECTCGQIFRRRSRMETCLRSHSMDIDASSYYSCASCPKHFKDKEELLLHRKRIHRKRFPCKFCPTDYNTRKELFKHLRIHQKVQLMEYKVISEVMEGKQKLCCFMCDKKFSDLSDLKSHVLDDHKEPYKCRKCDESFPKIIDFGHHTKTHHPEMEGQSVLDILEAFSKLVRAWKCEECDMQFHEADKLAKHQIEQHSPDLKSGSQFQCDDCRRVFITQKGLTSHRRIHHNTSCVEEAETIEGVLCVECRKICKDNAALTSHMRFHSLDRKYPCKFCDFRFATPEKRKAHSELHTGDMRYVCFICEYQCTSENRLNLHKMSIKHLNMKEFLLSKAAKQRSGEEIEKVEEGGPSVEDAMCDICGEKYANERQMLTHKESHPFIEFPNEDTPSRIFFK
ncbi:unnamed protein product [Leptidea sinapis]|uniref:C2H2-type domain-containing protein n=1 Tax=Leptidea sinapis TaxID=189913 RepID=A0A5E4QUZ3_9NEOP|nr:unnamed protein product [Leptidea sinapis]